MLKTPPTAPVPSAIQAYFAAIRRMDREAWVATFAADATSHDPIGSPARMGHDALRTFFDGITSLTQSVALWEDDVFACGNHGAVKWTGTGVGKNERAFRVEGIDVFELDERGKIKTLKAYWNPAELMAQLA